MKISNQALEEQVLSYRADLRKEISPNVYIENLLLSLELREYYIKFAYKGWHQ
jgi:hypothetical protein